MSIEMALPMLQLESWDVANSRRARIYGKIPGWSNSAGGYDVTAPRPDGTASAQCIELRWLSAGVRPEVVSQVNVHGTGTRLNDLAEAEALRRVFSSSAAPARHLDQRRNRTCFRGIRCAEAGIGIAVDAKITRSHRPSTFGPKTRAVEWPSSL